MKKNKETSQEEPIRVKIPRGVQVLGIVEQRVGGSRMYVKCLDGKTRLCRIPGRLKRRLWVREGNILLIEPWSYDNNKGDVVFKYKQTHIDWLRKKGYLKEVEVSEEF